jgi:hypothetical protein
VWTGHPAHTSLRAGPLVDELGLQAGVERLSELRL